MYRDVDIGRLRRDRRVLYSIRNIKIIRYNCNDHTNLIEKPDRMNMIDFVNHYDVSVYVCLNSLYS